MSLNEVIRQVDIGEIIRTHEKEELHILRQDFEQLQQDYTALEEEVNKKDLGLKQVSVEISQIEATLQDLESKIRVYGKEAKHKELGLIRATHADLQKRVGGLKEKLRQSRGPYTNRALRWVAGAGIAAVLFAGAYFLKDIIGDYGQRRQETAHVVVENKQKPAQEFQQPYAPPPPKTPAPQQQTAKEISDVVEKEEPSALGPKVGREAKKTASVKNNMVEYMFEFGNGKLYTPFKIVIRDNQIYVRDNEGKKKVFDLNGNYITSYDDDEKQREMCVFKQYNNKGYISQDSFILIMDYTGRYIIKQFGWRGSGNGEFMGATTVEIYHDKIYVADVGNHRIQIFDLDGNYKSKFGKYGSKKGEFKSLEDFVIHNGMIYVADGDNNRIQVFRIND